MKPLRLGRDQKITLLRKLDLFAECSSAELGRIASLMTEHSVPAGKELTRRGEPGLEAFVVVEGKASASRKGVPLAKLGPGALVGELALLDGGKRTATVTADTDMRLLVLSQREFARTLSAAPSFARKIISQLGARLRQTDDLVVSHPALTKAGWPWSV